MSSNRAHAHALAPPSPLSPLHHFFHQHLLSIETDLYNGRESEHLSELIPHHFAYRGMAANAMEIVLYFHPNSERAISHAEYSCFFFLLSHSPIIAPGRKEFFYAGFAHRPAFCFEKTKMVLLSWTTKMDGGPTGVPLAGSFLFLFSYVLFVSNHPISPRSGWKTDWLVAPQRAWMRWDGIL